jgi:hypothetical protein
MMDSWMLDSQATDVDHFLTFVFPGLMMDDALFQSTLK